MERRGMTMTGPSIGTVLEQVEAVQANADRGSTRAKANEDALGL